MIPALRFQLNPPERIELIKKAASEEAALFKISTDLENISDRIATWTIDGELCRIGIDGHASIYLSTNALDCCDVVAGSQQSCGIDSLKAALKQVLLCSGSNLAQVVQNGLVL